LDRGERGTRKRGKGADCGREERSTHKKDGKGSRSFNVGTLYINRSITGLNCLSNTLLALLDVGGGGGRRGRRKKENPGGERRD